MTPGSVNGTMTGNPGTGMATDKEKRGEIWSSVDLGICIAIDTATATTTKMGPWILHKSIVLTLPRRRRSATSVYFFFWEVDCSR